MLDKFMGVVRYGFLTIILLPITGFKAYADRPYGMAGCGLGSTWISSKSTGKQLFAFTTNKIGQPYSITTGTSNCVKDGHEKAYLQQDRFFVANYLILSKEIAQGSGDYFSSLSKLLGCPDDTKDQFGQFSKKNYADVFLQPGPLATLDELKEKLQADPILGQRCVYL